MIQAFKVSKDTYASMQDSGINEIDKQTSAGFHKCHGVIVESLHTSKTLVFNLHGVAATI